MFSFAQFLLNLGAQLENEHSWEKIRINWTICTFLQLWSWSSSLSSYIMQNHYRCHHNHCCHHHHHRPTGIFQNLGFSLPALWCLIPIFLINASFQIRYWTHIFMHTKLIVVFGFVLVDLSPEVIYVDGIIPQFKIWFISLFLSYFKILTNPMKTF